MFPRKKLLQRFQVLLAALAVLWLIFALSKLNHHARKIQRAEPAYLPRKTDFLHQQLSSHPHQVPVLRVPPMQTNSQFASIQTSSQFVSSQTKSQFVSPQRTASKAILKPRVFIYDLPPRFNDEIAECLTSPLKSQGYYKCFDLSNDGMGKVLFRQGQMVVCDSNQFSLEVIVHRHLLTSRHRTLDPAQADLFYIPAYMGLLCFCQARKHLADSIIQALFAFLNTMPSWVSHKPHLSTLAKIEREQCTASCPYLRQRETKRITFIGIEQEVSSALRRMYNRTDQKLIVAPYPSYAHFDPSPSTFPPFQWPSLEERKVLLFFAASDRRSNPFRAMLIDQFPVKTKKSYEKFMAGNVSAPVEQVMLITHECYGDHKTTTIPWMQRSIFCLQPAGDSPTRKSFYDSVLSGCIPVIFNYTAQWQVKYPFESVLNYRDFTVQLQAKDVEIPHASSVLSKIKVIPQTEIASLHRNLKRIAHLLQYRFPSNNSAPSASQDDAFEMILQEAKSIYKLS